MTKNVKILIIIFFCALIVYGKSVEAIKESHRGELPDYDNLTIQQIYENGRKLADNFQYKKAIHLYEIVIDRQKFKRLTDPDFQADLFYHLSFAYLQAGTEEFVNLGDKSSLKKSLEFAEACLGIKPRYWQAYENMGNAYTKLRDFDQADIYYTEALKYLDPQSPEYKKLAKQQDVVRRVNKMKKEKIKKLEDKANAPKQKI